MAAYWLVAIAYVWVIVSGVRVWRAKQCANRKRKLVSFAEHQAVFVIGLGLLSLVLCQASLADIQWYESWRERWWVVFDLIVALALLSQMKNLELALLSGRKG